MTHHSNAGAMDRRLVAVLALCLLVALTLVWWPHDERPGPAPPSGSQGDVCEAQRQIAGGQEQRVAETPAADPGIERSSKPTQSATERPWAITGIVIDQETDQPIPGATVSGRVVSTWLDDWHGEDLFGPVLTDHEGRFEVSVAELRTWTQATLRGYTFQAQAEARGYLAGQWRQPAPSPERRLDGAELVLELEAGIGTPLRGSVVDAGGAPVAGATLMANLSIENSTVTEEVTCDADGSFVLWCPELPAKGTLLAVHPAHGVSAPEPVTVGATELDVGRLVLDRPAGILAGTLRRASGEPVAGIRVDVLRLDDATGSGVSQDSLVARGGVTQDVWQNEGQLDTDSEGRFSFRCLQPGLYKVELDPVPEVVLSHVPVSHWVLPTQPRPYDLRIELESVSIAVVDQTGVSLFDAWVNSYGYPGGIPPELRARFERGESLTDADRDAAEFRSETLCESQRIRWGVPGTEWLIDAELAGYESARRVIGRADSQSARAVTLQLRALRDAGQLRVDLTPPPMRELYGYYFKLADGRGRAPWRSRDNVHYPESSIPGRWYRSSPDGVIRDLAAGRYRYELAAVEHRATNAVPEVFRRLVGEIVVEPGKTTVFSATLEALHPLDLTLVASPPANETGRFGRNARFQVTVTPSGGTAFVAELAKVSERGQLWMQDPSLHVSSAKPLRCRLLRCLPAGVYTVEIEDHSTPDPWPRLRDTVTLPATAPLEFRWQLR